MIEKVEQGTPEWFAARLGNVTASRVADVIAKTKSGYSASRENYMAQLICERMTNTVAESYTNAAMAWGTETEPLARAAYESYADVLVDEVGYIPHPTIERAGASPDGLVGLYGLLEIKCPNTATHIDTLISWNTKTQGFTNVNYLSLRKFVIGLLFSMQINKAGIPCVFAILRQRNPFKIFRPIVRFNTIDVVNC